jgi:anthranilate phosphoribosyltransferase
MKDLLTKLVRREDLTRAEAIAAFDAIMTGTAEPAQVGALLMGLAAKGPSVDEIVAAATVMREKSIHIALPGNTRAALDVCGTGGSVHRHAGLFNISTAAAIVIAACGVVVVKHGSRAATSKSGSADVLEALGVKLDVAPDQLTQSLCEANLCFAFARSHHPAMKFVAPIRASVGIPTIFNLLGPLTNPAGATHQLMGVFNRPLTSLLAAALLDLGTERAWVVNAEDGLDELSTMSATHVCEARDGELRETTITPAQVGLPLARIDDLRAADPTESAAIIRSIFSGKAGPPADIVVLNAAAGLVIAGKAKSMHEGVATARAAIADGAAARTLATLVMSSNA